MDIEKILPRNEINEEYKWATEDIYTSDEVFLEELKTAKSEARKEFAERINREIIEAIISNDKAIAERERKHNVNRYEDNFCAMCDGKVVALSGIKSFIDNLLKELAGDNQ